MVENSNNERVYAPIDFARVYQHGLIAARLAKNEESAIYLPGAMFNLHKAIKENPESPEKIYEKVVDATPEAQKKLIEISVEDYQEAKESISIGELYDWYEESFSSASAESKMKVRALLSQYRDKTIAEIKKEIDDANYILNPRTGASDEEKKKAEDSIKERKDVLGKISLLEGYSLEATRQQAVKASIELNLEAIVKEAA